MENNTANDLLPVVWKEAWTDGEKALTEMFPDLTETDWRPKAIKAFDDLLPSVEKFFMAKHVPREAKKSIFFRYNLARYDVKYNHDKQKLRERWKEIVSTINKETIKCH